MQRDLTFYSNGYRLAGVVHIPDDPQGPPSNGYPSIVVAGGFGAVKELRTPGVCEWLTHAGFVTLRFDYQGFGEAEGPKWRLIPLEQVQNIRDAITALSELPEVDKDRIGLFGNSWGGAPAAYAAAIDVRVNCLVTCGSPMDGRRWMMALRRQWEWLEFQKRLEAARVSRVQTGKSEYVPSDEVMVPDPRTDREHGASDKLLDWRFELPLETAEAIIEFRPEDLLGRISPRAVMFIHTADDGLVPLAEAYAGYAAAAEPKALHIERHAGHHDVYYSPTRETTMTAAQEWYSRHLSQ